MTRHANNRSLNRLPHSPILTLLDCVAFVVRFPRLSEYSGGDPWGIFDLAARSPCGRNFESGLEAVWICGFSGSEWHAEADGGANDLI